jgi:hypothetical protein
MLIKGPIVYAFLLPGIALFQGWRRKSGVVSGWCGWWPWVASLAIFLGWAIGGIKSVPGFYDQVVVREFMGRFGETIHRPQPIYFYLPHLLHKFAPWSVLMILLAVVAARSGGTRFRATLKRISPDTVWLIFWSLGGLLVMSVIPSKRVDRIFPVLPPLCLLLAAQVGSLRPNEQRRSLVFGWLAGALAFAVVFTGGYTVFKIVSGYEGRRDAVAEFGRAVRHEAAAQHWRYEAIAGSDEGMLLYLEKTHFMEPSQALSEWNLGHLDALVVPAEQAAPYATLADASAPPLVSAPRQSERGGDYVRLVRQK